MQLADPTKTWKAKETMLSKQDGMEAKFMLDLV